jgi:hypothetical protein
MGGRLEVGRRGEGRMGGERWGMRRTETVESIGMSGLNPLQPFLLEKTCAEPLSRY